MINPLVKLITVDGFFEQDKAEELFWITRNLNFTKTEFGEEIQNFNMVPENASELFSSVLGTKFQVDEERSGIFRVPDLFIHFESFENTNEWIFAVSLKQSTFNIYEHISGATTALQGYNNNYYNYFEWDLHVNYVLKAGQGILFRPWLFHSFDQGLVQLFYLKEIE